jgi:hypothetical protein
MNINMNEKTRVTLRTVCMLSLALVIGLGMTSCSEDESNCIENRKVRIDDGVSYRLPNFTIYSPLTEDVVVPAGYDAVVNGELVTAGFDIIASGTSDLKVDGNLIVEGDTRIKFRNGEIKVDGDLNMNTCDAVVTSDVTKVDGNVNGFCGVWYWCTELKVDGNLNYDPFVQDCETLSSGGGFGSFTKPVPCGLKKGDKVPNTNYVIVE